MPNSPTPTPTPVRRVQVLLFDDVEVLDFAGPFEVFSVTKLPDGSAPFRVQTVGLTKSTVTARGGLRIEPHIAMDESGPCDVLVLPGGFGTRREMHNEPLLAWIRQRSPSADVVLSVCTGALLLGRAGLLDSLNATTHHGAFEELEAASPSTQVLRGMRIVDNGHIVTSAGISAGIDASLHVVARLLGQAVAESTAEYMEYDWNAAAARTTPVTSGRRGKQ